jgi:hypothetical protein
MGRKRRPAERLHGTVTHRRTQNSYVGVMLDEVSEDDWREVVRAAVREAKAGSASARAFLSAYLIGRPAAIAPTPLTVVVDQISGADPLVDHLAGPALARAKFPFAHVDDALEDTIKAEIAAELAAKLPAPADKEREFHARVDSPGDQASVRVSWLPDPNGSEG